jgi:type VI secretion system protein ImpH
MEKMAPSSRQPDPTVEEQLFTEGYRFEFYQAVQLLEQLAENARPRLKIPIEIRFASTVSAAFPASDIEQIRLMAAVICQVNGRQQTKMVDFRDITGERYPILSQLEPLTEVNINGQLGRLQRIVILMQVNFMGLAGAHGPLPMPYTELIIERVWKKDTTLRDFLDLFNHYLISLLYRGRKNQRIGLETNLPWQSHFAQRLFALVGLGTPGLRERMALDDNALLFYAGLLTHQSRSLSTLEHLLTDFFQVKVTSQPWIGRWQYLSAESHTRLGINQSNQELGRTTVLGTRIWDQDGKFALSVGPLNLEQFRDFLPTGSGYTRLCELTRFFVKDELDFEINLILKADEIPESHLDQTTQLGWTAFLKSQPGQHNKIVKLNPPSR